MPTVNISLPEPLRDYLETRAEQGSYSASEYIRQLLRDDKTRHEAATRDQLWDLLAISAKQLDDGEGLELDVDRLLAEGRARRAAGQGHRAG